MSCLKDDFNLLPEGDQTVVGERGTTLSGGQKARVSLARALYSDADIYLMDDPISAVDAKVAKQIFDKCLRPLGKSKTVLLVTHQIGYITECEEVIVMNDGAIQAAGDSASLKTILNQLSEAFKTTDDEKVDDDDESSSFVKANNKAS